jgi:hypothetical protein
MADMRRATTPRSGSQTAPARVLDDPADVLAATSRSTVHRNVISAGTDRRIWTNHGSGA